MKLIKLRVEAFGRLKNYEKNFTDGLNVINEPNGFGKTTLADFICAMLYGLPETRSKNLLENPRLKYRPWGSHKFGGTLTIEHNGNIYRIERSFGKTANGSGDVLRVYNEKTGVETKDLGDVGRCLFGVDRDAFVRCVYLPQNAVEVKAEDDITRRLTETLTSSDEARYNEAMEKLDKERAFWYKTGGRGEIGRLKGELSESEDKLEKARAELLTIEKETLLVEQLEEKLAICEKGIAEKDRAIALEKRLVLATKARENFKEKQGVAERIAELKKRKAEKEAELSVLLQEEKSLGEQIADEDRKRTYISIAKEFRLYESEAVEKEKKAKEMNSCFTKMPNEAFFVKTEEFLREEDKCLKNIAEADAYIRKAKEDKEALKQPEKPKQMTHIIFCIVTAITVVLGILMLIFQSTLATMAGFIVLAGLVAVSLVFGVLALRVRTTYLNETASCEDVKNSCEAMITESEIIKNKVNEALDLRKQEIVSFMKQYGVDCGESVRDTIADVRRRRETAIMFAEDAERARGRLESFTPDVMEKVYAAESFSEEVFARLNERSVRLAERKLVLSGEIAGATSVIENNANYNEQLVESEKAYSQAKKGLSDEELSMEINEGEAEVLKAELVKERGELIKIVAEKHTLIRETKKRSGNVSEAEERCENLRREIKEGEKRLENVRTAMKSLEKANEALSSNYLPMVKKRFSEFLSRVGADKYPDAVIDGSFKIKLSEEGLSRELEYFSTGTRDLMYFGLRLCLMESMYGGVLPFLIVDDCFTNLDSEKFSKVSEILCSVAMNTQVVYMTCYREPRRVELEKDA